MGAYLSEPVTEKLSGDESNVSVQCGYSCMQGWRINQEDAHNTILDYDKDTMLFAVYDGHGGAEVAAYCAQKLPDYIKETDAYKSGDLTQALEDAFLGFDTLIATKEVMETLKGIAGQMNPPPDETGDTSEDDDESMSNLYQDAQLPLKEVLAKYENHCTAALRAKLGDGGTPLSPCLRAKKNKEAEKAGASSSSAGASSSIAGASRDSAVAGASSSAATSSRSKPEDGGVSSTSSNEAEKEVNGEVSTSDTDKGTSKESPKKAAAPVPDSSGDNGEEPQSSAKEKPAACNGEVSEGRENSISSSQNGDSANSKEKEKPTSVSSSKAASPSVQLKKSRVGNPLRRAAADMYKSLLLGRATSNEEDDDESDSNDENFEGAESNTSDEENVNGASESSNEEGEEGEGEEEEEEQESSDEEYDHMSMTEEPGNDSGCTAVVALLRGNQLYVGNAGDSRCIVCREGVAVDMSIDHKPEDAPELERITKAGGKVSNDGRINGGLNLSRAIGDHSYKQNKELNDKEQMITALPDVKTLTIDPEKDDFMVLACDGIWNFMSSQDVCDFISPRLREGRERLSQICEEMFDHCLAPNTVGDGTGCDNMTAVLVTFKKNAGGGVEVASVSTTDCAKKRSADDQEQADGNDSKRQKVEDTLSSSDVTSSV